MFIHPLVDGPAAFQVGSITITFYALMYWVGFFVFQSLGEYRLQKNKYLTLDEFDVLLNYGILGVIVGGYLGEMIFYHLHRLPEIFSSFPTDTATIHKLWLTSTISVLLYIINRLLNLPPFPILVFFVPFLLSFTHGEGMSFHGALIGVVIAVLLYSYQFKKNWLAIFDFITPLIPPGLGLGRLGNFANGELWGRPTQMPWGVIFPRIDFEVRHPSQLYESFLEGLVLFIILWHFSKSKRPRGAVFGLGMSLYAVFRIFVECFREPGTEIGFIAWEWLTMGQLLSFPMLLGGLYLLFNAYYFSEKKVP